MSYARRSAQEQLSAIRPALLGSRAPVNASVWKEDGVDHISIGRSSRVPLGRWLGLDSPGSFDHPVLGPFVSLNSLWFFLTAKDSSDAIRGIHGDELRKFIRNEGGTVTGHIKNFRAVIAHSAYIRVKSLKHVEQHLKDSVLPFDLYKTLPSGIRVRPPHSAWFCGAYEEIRSAVKENREPDFQYLMDDSNEIYDAVISRLTNGAVTTIATPMIATTASTVQAAVAEDGPKKLSKNQRRKQKKARMAMEAKETTDVPTERIVEGVLIGIDPTAGPSVAVVATIDTATGEVSQLEAAPDSSIEGTVETAAEVKAEEVSTKVDTLMAIASTVVGGSVGLSALMGMSEFVETEKEVTGEVVTDTLDGNVLQLAQA